MKSAGIIAVLVLMASGLLFAGLQGQPNVVSCSPNTASTGTQGPFAIVLKGSGFNSTAVARWWGIGQTGPRPTTYVSSHQLLLTVSSSDLSLIGQHAIDVCQADSTGFVRCSSDVGQSATFTVTP